MKELLAKLAAVFAGEITTAAPIRARYSHDASIFEITPDAIVAPRDSHDIQQLVRFVAKYKASYPSLALTPRSAGTDMSGAAIGHSLVVDMTRHFSHINALDGTILSTQPGVYMRDIDLLLERKQLFLGSVPASRAINTIGGMVGNNSGGERSLHYGNTDRSIRELTVVLADGHEYVMKPLNKRELDLKMAQPTFEGRLYKRVYELCEQHYDLIHNARPKVSKNSMGYNLWNVWDRDTGIFDMTQLITGSQGTLGIVTDLQIEAYPKAPHNGLLVAYVTRTSQLQKLIPLVMKHQPVTFEGFDDVTFNLGIKYFNTFRKQLGMKEWLKQQTVLLGQTARFRGHLPNIVLMIEFDGESRDEIDAKITALLHDLAPFHLKTTTRHDDRDSALFWEIRRASFSLLRSKVHTGTAAPFIDDLTVQPRYVHVFLPRLRALLRHYKVPATIAGHFGDGNFHMIPIMDLTKPRQRAKLEPLMRDLVPIILEYGGTLAGEHNDGMIRGPWLPAVFGEDVAQLFREIKELFDPLYIFNPHKKTDASWDYSMAHLRTETDNSVIA